MTDTPRAFVTIGAQIGGKDAFHATHTHILKLRTLLADRCQGPYGDVIKEIALILRVDGSIDAWERQGVDGLVWRSKGAYAQAEIWISRKDWSERDAKEFQIFLASHVQEAIAKIIVHVTKRGVTLNGDTLARDVADAARAFLST